MKKTGAAALRQHFLDYFARHGHAVVKSSPLIPANDPTLMFTNAGMVQFKDVFVGAEARPYTRATSSQKCMRVSGKHNDLEEVGRTARHHTFFEMLGNFSFGDYFKAEAIELAWKFLVDEVGLDRSRLWVTVFGGEQGIEADDEARQLWRRISGLPEDRILGMGMKDNFWAMGDTGPCGPCTEVHYDHGSGGEPTLEDFETGRLVEIWNNVFMQFERKASGELVPLPAPSVDTGMGLERLAAVVQGVQSNYDTDLFTPILEAIADAAGKPYGRSDAEDDVAMRVIADHARATAFLVADGLQPGPAGRQYVMRRIMRRAIRFGKRLGFDSLFFDRACEAVVEAMGDVYLELAEARTLIKKVADAEERSFRETLDRGLRLLDKEIDKARGAGEETLSGEAVFELYTTYGFPPDLTELIASENLLAVDMEDYDRRLEKFRNETGGAAVGDTAVADVYKSIAGRLGEVEFIGYVHEDEPLDERPGSWRLRGSNGATFLEAETTVKALVKDGAEVTAADDGVVELVLDPTPYYGESGGQVGDKGLVVSDNGLEAEVIDTQKPFEGLTVARCRVLDGRVTTGQVVWAGYRPEIRKETRAHHSATHLLHASLRKVIGDHVKQAGSLVDPDHLRFDYSHFEAPTAAQLRQIEDDANARVQADDQVITEVLPFGEAKEKGAIALFGEKYGDTVRVITMGGSVEFCGGTHARRTSDIGMLLVTREEAVASGVRRIEAEVGAAARRRTVRSADKLAAAADMLSGRSPAETKDRDPILAAVAKLIRHGAELCDAVGEAGGEPAVVEVGEILAPSAGDPIDVERARAIRDLWQGVVQLANARAQESEEIETATIRLVTEHRAADLPTQLLGAVGRLIRANRENERKLEQLRLRSLTSAAGDLMSAVKEIGDVKLLATRVDGVDGKALRGMADDIRSRLGSGVLCLGGDAGGKATLLVAVTKDLTERFQAGTLIKELAPIIGGRGGGKPELAQAGGNKPAALEQLFDELAGLVERG
jgi:alanyl-tRNA synthetase